MIKSLETDSSSNHRVYIIVLMNHFIQFNFNSKDFQQNIPFFFQDEAERWKERGKTLFKEKNFPLLIKYYSLAIKFTSPEENFLELRSILLSNRSIAYNKTRMYQEALEDAKECVRINPRWSKVCISA